MFKRSFAFTAAAALLLITGYGPALKADQPNKKLVIPVKQTSPADGKAMYQSYCASCHGTDGRGLGPMAAVLKSKPTDLTVLANSHGGKFPTPEVVALLLFGPNAPSHGTAQMPVWGPALGKISNGNTPVRTLRISNLCKYLQSIQTK